MTSDTDRTTRTVAPPTLALAIVLATLLAGYALVRLATLGPPAGPAGGGNPSPSAASASPLTPLPTADVEGADLAGLPRYPGAVRVAYTENRSATLARVTIAYVAEAADLAAVQAFYRRGIDEGGWLVGDVAYRPDAWTFFLIDREREVVLEIIARDSAVEISVDATEPIASPTLAPTPRPTAAPTPPLPTPRPTPSADDDDDGDEGDD